MLVIRLSNIISGTQIVGKSAYVDGRYMEQRDTFTATDVNGLPVTIQNPLFTVEDGYWEDGGFHMEMRGETDDLYKAARLYQAAVREGRYPILLRVSSVDRSASAIIAGRHPHL
jgi:hypothetical protein